MSTKQREPAAAACGAALRDHGANIVTTKNKVRKTDGFMLFPPGMITLLEAL